VIESNIYYQKQRGNIMELTTTTKTRRGLKLYETNPFPISLETKKKPIYNKNKDMALVHGVTGEMQQLGGFVSYEEVSSEKFVQLFISGVRQLEKLTTAGARVFTVLYQEVQNNIGKDLVYMNYATIDQTLQKMSTATYDRGIRELVQKGFIAPTPRQSMYWLNPNYIFNGDKLTLAKTYILKEKAKALEG
jgi:hypothetical protein